jgi:signal transduction histidine kinase
MRDVGATEFAPAARAPDEELKRQVAHFESNMPHSLLDAIPVALTVINRQRQMVYANRQFLLVLGTEDIRELYGKRPGESLSCIHAAACMGGCGTSKYCRECGAVRAVLTSLAGTPACLECRILRQPAGRLEALDLRVWASPMEWNQELFVLVALLDIGHEKRREALDRIFFHDILNTACVLQSAARLVDRSDAERVPDLLKAISKSSSRIVEEIQAQRDLLAAERDELAIQPAAIRAKELLGQLVDAYLDSPLTNGRNLRIADDSCEIDFVSDRVLIGRVIGNMIKNALEACEIGGTITVGCRKVGAEVEVWVHNPDSMSEPSRLQVFHRSFSTKGAGRGLGTYSMQLLSERYLQGNITFTTSPEGGTTFTGRYPLRLDPAQSA